MVVTVVCRRRVLQLMTKSEVTGGETQFSCYVVASQWVVAVAFSLAGFVDRTSHSELQTKLFVVMSTRILQPPAPVVVHAGQSGLCDNNLSCFITTICKANSVYSSWAPHLPSVLISRAACVPSLSPTQSQMNQGEGNVWLTCVFRFQSWHEWRCFVKFLIVSAANQVRKL